MNGPTLTPAPADWLPRLRNGVAALDVLATTTLPADSLDVLAGRVEALPDDQRVDLTLYLMYELNRFDRRYGRP
jgi:hypothetical protein